MEGAMTMGGEGESEGVNVEVEVEVKAEAGLPVAAAAAVIKVVQPRPKVARLIMQRPKEVKLYFHFNDKQIADSQYNKLAPQTKGEGFLHNPSFLCGGRTMAVLVSHVFGFSFYFDAANDEIRSIRPADPACFPQHLTFEVISIDITTYIRQHGSQAEIDLLEQVDENLHNASKRVKVVCNHTLDESFQAAARSYVGRVRAVFFSIVGRQVEEQQ